MLMWDKAHLKIPFKEQYVFEGRTINNQRSGMVDFKQYDFKAQANVLAFVDGKPVHDDPDVRHWDSIPTSISELAVGFFPKGEGFDTWPCVVLKASPSKILQGHNVFGTEDLRPGVMQMLAVLSQAFPKIAAHLNFKNAIIRYLDTTYSAFVISDYLRNQVLRVFESLCTDKHSMSRYEGYLKLNKSSDYQQQKIYYKHQELMASLDEAQRKRQHEKVKVLSDKRLHDFAFGRLRFEGTTGHRAMEREGLPTNLHEFLKFHDWYQKAYNEPICRLLWRRSFQAFFKQLEGHTMKNVDDDHIKLKIDAKYIKVKENGKLCKRKANAVWRTYRQIKTEGYSQLAKEGNKTFFRNVGFLNDIGLSRAFLKSLDPMKPNDNVIPLVQIIDVDFSQQRPSWYVEPTAGFDDPARHLRLVS